MSYARWPPVLPRHRPPSSPIRSRRPRFHRIRTRRVKASHLSHLFRVPPSKTPQSLTNGHPSQYPCSSPRSHHQLLATSHLYAPNVIRAHLAHVSNDTDVYASDTLPDHVHHSIIHEAIPFPSPTPVHRHSSSGIQIPSLHRFPPLSVLSVGHEFDATRTPRMFQWGADGADHVTVSATLSSSSSESGNARIAIRRYVVYIVTVVP